MATIHSMLAEIDQLARTLPPGVRNKMMNRTSGIRVALRKAEKAKAPKVKEAPQPATEKGETTAQIQTREIARKNIENAMKGGRKISLLDSKEFKVSQMHTQVCAIRRALDEG